jgi:integrase/recombinase XerD
MAASKSLTALEIDKLLQHIAQRPNALRNRVMLMFTVLAGLRVSEVADLRIADVRNADGTVKAEIYLAAHRVKHEHARTVYVSSRLQQEIAEYITTRPWLCDTQPLFYTQKSMRRGFSANTLCQHFFWQYRAAGISGASSHAGRKTFLT